MKIILPFLLILFSYNLACAQGSRLPLQGPSDHIVDRFDIKGLQPLPFQTSLNFYTRGDLIQMALGLDSLETGLSKLDQEDLLYLFKDNNEWLATYRPALSIGEAKRFSSTELQEQNHSHPRYIKSRKPFLGVFYKTPANLLEVDEPGFQLRVNPMLNFKLGAMQNDDTPWFINQRGVELRGGIDHRIYFYTNIIESQANFPAYGRNWIKRYQALPGNGFFKEQFANSTLGFSDGFDFLNSQAYVGMNLSEHVGVQLGHGKHFIGNGYRSLLLSDFSNNYFYLQLNWRVWKFHFQNIFAEVNARSAQRNPVRTLVPKKYMAAHYLNIRLRPNLEVGLFESVIFNRSGQFELQYLNPVILYRTVEQGLGSADNVLIGLNAKWNLFHRLQLYGQLMLDEFKFDELFLDGNGWWANKYGIQLGLKQVDVLGIDHLDVQLEYNLARPYTYTHYDSLANYTHYGQPLAHPLGANFRESLLILKYQPSSRIFLEGRIISSLYGEDHPNENWGKNWNYSYESREQDLQNTIGQGIRTENLLLGFDASYMLAHNVFLDLHYFYRRSSRADQVTDQTDSYFGGGIRVNMNRWRMDF